MESPTPDAAQRARDRFLERIAIYKSFGYDRPAAVRFVVDHLQPVEGEPFPDQSFDAVATLNALQHLDDGPAVFREMRRVVKPSGKILLAELTDEGFALVARVHESEGRVHPVGSMTVSLAVEWFVSNGFRLTVAEERYCQSVAVLERPERH
jgi:SAM-dependent methyltransferase